MQIVSPLLCTSGKLLLSDCLLCFFFISENYPSSSEASLGARYGHVVAWSGAEQGALAPSACSLHVVAMSGVLFPPATSDLVTNPLEKQHAVTQPVGKFPWK